jgi:hypothetical protein
MTKGELFIIGGQRSGTTYLMNLLEQHKSIVFAKPKFPEPKFFIKNPNAGKDEFKDALFKEEDIENKIIGEKSTSYFEHPKALKKIHLTFPKAKIIFLVRNPIDRAISNYNFSVENGLEQRSMREAFENPEALKVSREISVNPFNYLGRSEYSKYIKSLNKIFPKSRLHILSFEKLIEDTESYINHTFKTILGLNPIGINYEVDKNTSKKRERVADDILEMLTRKLSAEIVFLKNNNLL